jgi:DNA-binding IclR family transcriptional regulator
MTSPAIHDFDSEPDAADRYRAPALDKGLDILELLCTQADAMTRAEIVRALNRNPSEIYRMLERLVARRYVRRSPEGDRFSPTLKLFMLSHRYPPLQRFIAQARPLLDAFAKSARQSCHLGLYERGNITVVAEALSPGKLTVSVRPGSVVSLVDTGSGHVLLAHQSAARRAEMLAEHEPLEGETSISPAEQEKVLARTRERGYWQAPSRHVQGIVDISVPVLDHEGVAFGAVTCPFVRTIDLQESPDENAARSLLLKLSRSL